MTSSWLWDAFWVLCAGIGFLVLWVIILSMLAVMAGLGWIAAVVSITLAASMVWVFRIISPTRKRK